MRTVERFGAVDPSESNYLTYVFSSGLSDGETLLSATVTVTVAYGIDPSPQAIIQGVPQIAGANVMVAFGGLLNNVDYDITVTAVTSSPSKILALGKILPCRKQ